MDLTGWTPMYSYFDAERLMLDCCYTGRRRFTEPFFGDTIDHAMGDPAVRLFRHQISIDQAMEQANDRSRQVPRLSPSGFIFHMSRCGSTLVSRMLAALPQHRVLSEPTPLNAVVRAALLDKRFSRSTILDWLRTLIGLLSRPLDGETRCFIKLDCWHVLALPLFRQAFPDTPWIFLYRNPAEVLVSQARCPGAWTVWTALEPEVFGVNREDVVQMPRSEYLARALARMGEAALEYRDCGRGLLVNYDELPEFVCGSLPGHFGAVFSPGQLERIRSVSATDAKTPQLTFSDDRPAKRELLTPVLRAATDQWLAPLFDRLERVREANQQPRDPQLLGD